jgi:hypothetical protein
MRSIALRTRSQRRASRATRPGSTPIDAIETELAKIDTAIERLVVKFEEYDDPEHPVVKATERRIEQQSAKRKALEAELKTLRRQSLEQPAIETVDFAELIDSLPDIRPALST